MDGPLFGASAVRLSAPYLGVQIGAAAHGAPPPDNCWTPDRLERISRETWANAIGKDKHRTAALHDPASISMQAAHMNIYITSPCMYAAAYCMPRTQDMKDIDLTCARFSGPAAALPVFALSGLGTVCRLKGALRRPQVQFQTTMLAAALRGDIRIPACLHEDLANNHGHCLRWARRPNSGRAIRRDLGNDSARQNIVQILAPGAAPNNSQIRKAAPAIYEALWHHHDSGRFLAWQQRRSRLGRGCRSGGAEWETVLSCKTYTQG